MAEIPVVNFDVEAPGESVRRRASVSSVPAATVQAGARFSEETARRGGQKREISADLRMCICDKRTNIDRFIYVYRVISYG